MLNTSRSYDMQTIVKFLYRNQMAFYSFTNPLQTLLLSIKADGDRNVWPNYHPLPQRPSLLQQRMASAPRTFECRSMEIVLHLQTSLSKKMLTGLSQTMLPLTVFLTLSRKILCWFIQVPNLLFCDRRFWQGR